MRTALIIIVLMSVPLIAFGCDRPTPPATTAAPTPAAPATPAAPSATAAPGPDESLLARCRAAADYSRQHDGEVVLVLLDGQPIFQDLRPGFTTASPHLLASGTKSFSGFAAALAMDDGLITLDERVSDTIHEWKADPRKSTITLRQLLSLSGGLDPLSTSIDNPRHARAAGITNRATASIQATLRADPGDRFIYGPSSFYVFGEFMKRKLAAAGTGDADVVAYLQRRAFTPLGIEPRFLRDEAGNANLPGGCRVSATGWATFGEMVRNGGMHQGKRLVSEASLAELLTPHGPNTSYGLTWWLLRDGEHGADPETALAQDIAADRLQEQGGAIRERLSARLRDRAAESRQASAVGEPVGVMAAGKGKQRLYVLPGARMTVVRFGPLEGSRAYRDQEFLRILLGR